MGAVLVDSAGMQPSLLEANFLSVWRSSFTKNPKHPIYEGELLPILITLNCGENSSVETKFTTWTTKRQKLT